ncbi:MAG: RDD family protein [Epsilonproteobacteria bacterium]|nr:MAG: RDD family protein [Campylobacterota bacterium]
MNNNIDINSLSLATTRTRAIAFVVDDILITLVAIAVLWDSLVGVNSDNITSIINDNLLKIVFLKFVYHTLFVWYYGATIGKIVVKIRVVDFDTYKNISLLKSAIRAVGRVISEFYFYIGFTIAFFTASRQTFHDKLSKTLVIKNIE